MSARLRCDVESVGDRILVHVTGELAVSTAPRLRITLFKCLMEQPEAVVVDVAGLTVTEAPSLSVFAVVARQASLWPGTPLLLAAVPAAMAAMLAGGGYGRLQMVDSVEQALSTEPRHRMTSLSEVLLPAPGSARQARELVTEACMRWDVPELVGPASLIVSELVTNVVVHARTLMDLRISRGRRYLIIAVRDGASEPPRRPGEPPLQGSGGRGLLLVEALALRWGHAVADDGKVVWAALPISRR